MRRYRPFCGLIGPPWSIPLAAVSPTAQRLPCRSKQQATRRGRASVVASSLTSVAPRSKRASGFEQPGSSKEDDDVLGQQYVLVEDDPAAGDLPGAGNAAQDIAPGADIKVLLGLGPAAIHHEIRIDLDLARRVAGFHFDIGYQVARARRRVLGPGHARIQPRNALAERLLGLVEDRQLVLFGQIVLNVPIRIEDRDRLA